MSFTCYFRRKWTKGTLLNKLLLPSGPISTISKSQHRKRIKSLFRFEWPFYALPFNYKLHKSLLPFVSDENRLLFIGINTQYNLLQIVKKGSLTICLGHCIKETLKESKKFMKSNNRHQNFQMHIFQKSIMNYFLYRYRI